MRLNRLDLNLLIALDALLTEQSITRAAERIHLSQPATSGALARLREFFEDDLLVRVGAQMQPTPLGESLAVPVHNILMQIQATVERRLDFDAATSDRCFRILASDYTTSAYIEELALRLTRTAPNVQLEIIAPTSNPWEKLEQGDIDFLVMPEHILSNDHPSAILFTEGFVCLGWEENPELQDGLDLKTFLKLGHVVTRFGPNRVYSQDQLILREKHGIEVKAEIITSNFNSLPKFVNGTHRISVMYERLAQEWCNYLPLKTFPVPVDMPAISWGIQWHKFREMDPGIQWLKKEALRTAREH